MKKDILKLTPHLEEKVWGGTNLEKVKKLSSNHFLAGKKIGESFEVSILKDNESRHEEKLLTNFLTKEQLPYLVKLIDTTENLSIQVHPDDAYAKANENSSGKSECWIILDSKENSGIYLGLKDNVSKEKLKDAILNKDDLSNFLHFYNTKKGDFFFVPAGSMHAIGSDVLLLEVQQSSGITYRVWDWNRVGLDGKPRELHVEKAMDVINFRKDANTPNYFQHKKDIFSTSERIATHNDFNVYTANLIVGNTFELTANKRALSIICIEGNATVESTDSKQEITEYESLAISPQTNIKITTSTHGKIIWIN